MGRAGDCVTCFSRQRAAIEAARADGRSFANLSRSFGIAEASVRRHFKSGHAKPAAPVARPAAVATAPSAVPRHPKASDPDPEVSFARVKKAAEYLNVPLGELALCLENHIEVHVATANEAEEEELFAAWDAADECDEYCQAIVRSGKFITETAE